MANVVKHRFASAKADGPDATQVQPSHWNDGHIFTGGSAGDVLTRDPTDATYGAKWASESVWIAYTPTWMSDPPPAPTIGNGVLTGVYTVIGKTVHYQIRFAVGSTTSGITAGAWWGFTLPVSAARSSALGPAWMQKGAAYYIGTGVPGGWLSGNLVGAVTVFVPVAGQANGAILQPTLPFTWDPTATLFIAGTYDLGLGLFDERSPSPPTHDPGI